jgi:hypothetical protein
MCQVSADGVAWREIWWPGWTAVEARYTSRIVLRSAHPVYPTPTGRLHTTQISLGLLWTAPLLATVHAVTIAFPAMMFLSSVLRRHRLGQHILYTWLFALSAADLILFIGDLGDGDSLQVLSSLKLHVLNLGRSL